MVDFWKDYDGTNNDDIPPIRGCLIIQHSTFFNDYSFEGLDIERIKAYCKATGKKYEKQAINAKFMNEMEDWYLNLAKQYSALDKIRAEITQEYTRFRNKSDMWSERACGLGTALEIIDKYRKVEE